MQQSPTTLFWVVRGNVKVKIKSNNKILLVSGEYKEYYPKRNPENLSVFLIYIIVASKISLLLFVSKRESPYKGISLLTLSEKDMLSETGFTLFIRSKPYWKKWL